MADKPIPADDTLIPLLLSAAQDDEVVRKAVRMLAMKVLDRADFLLTEGSPSTRITVIRAIMPALVKTLEKKEDDNELAELRKVLNEVRDELRSGPTTIVRIPGPPTIPDDTAPIPTPPLVQTPRPVQHG